MTLQKEQQALIEQKQVLRTQLKQLRNALLPAQQERYSRLIQEKLLVLEIIKKAKIIFCFVSHGSEVSTRTMLQTFLQEDRHVLVPKITAGKKMIAVPCRSLNELEPGELGILTPHSDEAFVGNIDVCITPGLGFSITKQRIGFGKGYYDTWFSENEVSCKIGIAYDCQVLETLPSDESDIPMDKIVTEKKIY